jgi:hypothetical protein
MYVCFALWGLLAGLCFPFAAYFATDDASWIYSVNVWQKAESGGHWRIEIDAPGAQLLVPHQAEVLNEYRLFKARLQSVGLDLPPAHVIDSHQQHYYDMSTSALQWSLLPLRMFSVDMELRRFFPYTSQLLDSMPRVQTMSLSVLTPRSFIKPHTGASTGVQRCTLYLSAPQESSCEDTASRCSSDQAYFTLVGGDTESSHLQPQQATTVFAQNGTAFCFWDMEMHQAANPTSHARVALLVDYSIPLSGFLAELSAKVMRVAAAWHPRLLGMQKAIKALTLELERRER